MTELPYCLQPSKLSDNNDYEIYKKGEFELEEWEDVNYCEHSFRYGDDGLTDREVVDLLYAQNKEIEQLKETIRKMSVDKFTITKEDLDKAKNTRITKLTNQILIEFCKSKGHTLEEITEFVEGFPEK